MSRMPWPPGTTSLRTPSRSAPMPASAPATADPRESTSDAGAQAPVGVGQVHGGGRREVADGGQALPLHRIGGRDDRGGLQALHPAGDGGGDRGLQRRELQRRQRDS